MRDFLKRFVRTEDGAITVDWVVLTAAVIGVAIAVIAAIAFASKDSSDSIGNTVGAMGIMGF